MNSRTVRRLIAVAVVLCALVASVLVLSARPSVKTARAEEDGIFISRCEYSHSAQDDPIVFPGHSGHSHMHDFFGNKSTDANSTYDSLRAGETTCSLDGDDAAYWVPALYDSGKRVVPTSASLYFRAGAKDGRLVRAFPAGLMVVAKDDNIVDRFGCAGKSSTQSRNPAPREGSAPTCPAGTDLVAHHLFPDCWDGVNLDSADHTSHVAFARAGACPSTHPVPVPALMLNIHYPTDGGDIALGSTSEPVGQHADFFNAWDQPTLERLVATCLNAGRQCGSNPSDSPGR